VSRIIVLCEGDTEELAVRYFIARQWQSDGLGSVERVLNLVEGW